MKVTTAQKLHKIMAGPVGTMAVGATTALMLMGAGFLMAVIMLGTAAEPGNPTRTPTPVPSPTGEMYDPYVRCLMAMDAAELAAELCEPLDD